MTSSAPSGSELRRRILEALAERGPSSRRELMDRVRGNRGLISREINALRDEGLLEPTDRGFALTEEGWRALARPAREYEYRNRPVRLTRGGPEVEAFLRVIRGESKSRTGSIVATTRCDMRCKFCYYNLVRDHVDLTPEEILEEARRRVEAGNREVVIQGASPHTLGADLVEAVELIKDELNVTVGVGTGPLIPTDLLEDLRRAGLDYLKLSFSGRTREEWRAVTGRSRGFDEFWEVVAWCHRHGLEVTFVGGVVGLPGIPEEADAERVLTILRLNPSKTVLQFNPVQDPARGPLRPEKLPRIYGLVRDRAPDDVILKSCCVSPASWRPLYEVGRILEQRILNELYERGPMDTRELARRLRVSRRRLHRRLRSMEERGLIARRNDRWVYERGG